MTQENFSLLDEIEQIRTRSLENLSAIDSLCQSEPDYSADLEAIQEKSSELFKDVEAIARKIKEKPDVSSDVSE